MAGHRNYPETLRLLKHTDMTIHWKGIEERAIVYLYSTIFGAFSEFFFKNLSLTLFVPGVDSSCVPGFFREFVFI
jgi:hypothetical protein